MNMDQALQAFIVESRELLDDMEAALLRVLQEEDPADSINAIFRAAHTIKGSAGLFGLDFIVDFAHVVESVLDRVRDGEVQLGETVLALLLACGDHIAQLVTVASEGESEAGPELDARAEPLLRQLREYLAHDSASTATALPAGGSALSSAEASSPGPARGSRPADHWHISLRFGQDVLRNGMDPLSFLRYLNKLGSVTTVATLPGALPSLQQMDAESCYLGFELVLRSEAAREAIEGAFEFVMDDCKLRILSPDSPASAYIDLIREHAGDDEELACCLGEILVSCGSLTPEELRDATSSDERLPASLETLPDTDGASLLPSLLNSSPNASPARQKQSRDAKSGESQSVRVDADKLDRLVDLVGELITASATAMQAGRGLNSETLHEAHSTLDGLVQEVRDSALQLRMVKIGGTFSRFQRVVHDVSREIGKDIALIISGEDTELDKTVVEKIGDPLTHLVRNSMDHGIEPAEVRTARGKSARGCVRLNAYHDSGSIVIEVGDDGGGLSKDKIMAKAVERGLVEAGKTLTDQEIYALIFEPGFSTADQVTNLSGRGVGMDVVKRNITALRGAVSIDSQPGEGTTVTVRLPLTLAIINGFQVAVGDSVFVLPLEAIEECVEFHAETGHDFTELRGQVLPFIRLRALFNVGGEPGNRQSIVVVRHGGQRLGLIVDRLLGEAQTVIKPLARMFAHLQGISGSSILGSGDVALILDVAALATLAQNGSRRDAGTLDAMPLLASQTPSNQNQPNKNELDQLSPSLA